MLKRTSNWIVCKKSLVWYWSIRCHVEIHWSRCRFQNRIAAHCTRETSQERITAWSAFREAMQMIRIDWFGSTVIVQWTKDNEFLGVVSVAVLCCMKDDLLLHNVIIITLIILVRTTKYSSRMHAAYVPIVLLPVATRCEHWWGGGGPIRSHTQRREDWGRETPCIVRSNASWVMVTWGPGQCYHVVTTDETQCIMGKG